MKVLLSTAFLAVCLSTVCPQNYGGTGYMSGISGRHFHDTVPKLVIASDPDSYGSGQTDPTPFYPRPPSTYQPQQTNPYNPPPSPSPLPAQPSTPPIPRHLQPLFPFQGATPRIKMWMWLEQMKKVMFGPNESRTQP